MTAGKPEQDDEKETLAERSARLEAEAAGMDKDPENLPEDPPADEGGNNAAALEQQLAETRDQMMRALAEVENTRRRAAKEREDASKYAVSGFAKDLLDVADNLRRALDSVPEDLAGSDERIKNLLDGIEATEREMLRAFEKNGIQKLNPAGEVFDPNFHEVMFEAPGTGQPPGTIIEVIETGYVLNGRLLRPARVGVAKDEGRGGGKNPPVEPGGQIDTQA